MGTKPDISKLSTNNTMTLKLLHMLQNSTHMELRDGKFIDFWDNFEEGCNHYTKYRIYHNYVNAVLDSLKLLCAKGKYNFQKHDHDHECGHIFFD